MSRRSLYQLPALRFIVLSTLILVELLYLPFSPLAYTRALAVDVPTLLSPVDGSVITATGNAGSVEAPPLAIPEFSWSLVSDATSYRLQLSQDQAFTTKIEFTTPYNIYTPVLASQLNDGIWYWRVRVDAPVAGQYQISPFSFEKEWATPDNVPALTTPVDGTVLDFYDAPTFTWQPVLGAAQYRFQISSDPNFSTLAYNQLTLSTSIQPPAKLANGQYYWRVIPVDPADREGTKSDGFNPARSFQVSYQRVPVLLEPADNATPTFTPTFHWRAVRGAQFYRLQYTTDPTFNIGVISLDTRNTTYSPTTALPNDVNYYWRVRAHSGNSISDWSLARTFRKQWYIQPQLLTPVNTYQAVRFPLYSWTPVPGASSYKIEISCTNSFPPSGPCAITADTGNTFYTPVYYYGGDGLRYWRVTPYDRNNNAGKPSNVSSYRSSQDFIAPHQIYPFYYYPPDQFLGPSGPIPASINPHEDRTAALPIFMWQRVTTPFPTGGTFTNAYRIQVSDDPLFNTTDWVTDTQNLVAAPTKLNNFVPVNGVDYFWRVCPLDTLGGTCQLNAGLPGWSQSWKARFNLNNGLTPTSGGTPTLLRPTNGFEFIETTPLLEWWPYAGADEYEVQVSRDPNFAAGYTEISTSVTYPVFAPTQSLAERTLNRLNYGTFYWRVRAVHSGAPITGWSQTWRFQIASQSEWLRNRSIGAAANHLEIASDPDDTADDNFELTKLYASQSADYWFFGLNIPATSSSTAYVLYLDQDHRDNYGATSDARSYNVTTVSYHRPEYAIYINNTGGVFSAAQVSIYAWNGVAWGTPVALDVSGGELYYNAGYLEIKVINTAIGMQQETGSYAVSLFSVDTSTGQPKDSVPADPNLPGSNLLSRFASVSERMNLRMPPNAELDPTTYPSILPIFWEYPTGSVTTAPWAGVNAKVYLDPQYTTEAANFDLTSNGAYYADMAHAWPSDFDGDNTYYWRIRTLYRDSIGTYLGAWSQGWRFERQGFTPVNLAESVTFATPTFSWDMVEGAKDYDLQVDNDPNFGSPTVSVNTSQNTYTTLTTLANGTYYWRVRVQRYGGVENEWSQVRSFTMALPYPANLRPNDPVPNTVLNYAPSFCWDPLIQSDQTGIPVLAAFKYHIQVSKGDPTFSTRYEEMDTEQSCWTPTKGYADADKYYWRVAMYDGNNNIGDYSPVAVFTKQYPITTLVSPLSGQVSNPPRFEWTPVPGAARYKLEVSLYNTFSPLFDQVTTNAVTYTPTKKYDNSKTYFWRVAIIDNSTNVGPFTGATIITGYRLSIPFIKK